MNFREATDELFVRVDQPELAKALGVSVASIRQARLAPKSLAHRKPPADWRNSVIRLAEQQVWHYRKLIERVREEKRDEEPV